MKSIPSEKLNFNEEEIAAVKSTIIKNIVMTLGLYLMVLWHMHCMMIK